MNIIRVLVPAALVVGLALPARATTTYSSKAALESGNVDLSFTQLDFSFYVTGNGTTPCPCTSITIGGITFTDSTTSGITVPNSTTLHMSAGGTLTVSLGSAPAFGSNIVVPGGTLVNLSFTGDGAPFSNSYGPGVTVFLGARVTAPPITAFTYALGPGTTFDLTNFEFGTGGGSSAPESASFLSLGAGLAALGAIRRKLRH